MLDSGTRSLPAGKKAAGGEGVTMVDDSSRRLNRRPPVTHESDVKPLLGGRGGRLRPDGAIGVREADARKHVDSIPRRRMLLPTTVHINTY